MASQPPPSDSGVDDLRAGRAALLDLLAGLFLGELDLSVAQALAADPALAEALRPPSDEAAARALRAEYARLLLLEAPPYASLFLDAPPVIGGETARRWEALLTASGAPLPALERAAARDHLGLYLRALASGERAGASALALSETLRWAPQYLTTLERADPEGFYGRLAQVTAYALAECARHTAPPPVASSAQDAEPAPPPEDDRLRTLTRWLCTPLWSGWYLSPSDLRAFARSFGSPPGRIDRAALLEQAFEASGLDERTDDLLAALLALVEQWREAVSDWVARLDGWSASLTAWRTHLEQTHAILSVMREEARTPSADPDPTDDALESH